MIASLEGLENRFFTTNNLKTFPLCSLFYQVAVLLHFLNCRSAVFSVTQFISSAKDPGLWWHTATIIWMIF